MSLLALTIVFIAFIYAIMSWHRSEVKGAIEEAELKIREDIANFHLLVARLEDELEQHKEYLEIKATNAGRNDTYRND